MALYNITGNGFLDGLISGIGNMATGGGLAKIKQQEYEFAKQQEEQQRQRQIADLLSNQDMNQQQKLTALMYLSPEVAQGQLAALSPEFQLKQQEAQNQNAYRMGSLAVDQGGLDVQRQQQALAQQKYQAEMEAAQQRQALQQQMMQGMAGGADPQSLVMMGAADDPIAAAKALASMRNMQVDNQAKASAQMAAEAKPSAEALSLLRSTRQTLGSFKEAINNVGDWSTGRIANLFPNFTDATQYLASTSNQLALQAKTLLGMPSANFSDADRNFLVEVAGSTGQNKDTLKANASRLEGLLNQQEDYHKTRLSYIQQNGTANGFEENYQYKPTSRSGSMPALPDLGGEPVYDFNGSDGFNLLQGGGGKNEVQGNAGNDTLGFIKQAEGFSPVAYNDGFGNQTTGYGHKMTGQETTTDPDQLLQQDVASAAKAVDSMVKVPLNDGQRNALISFVYNGGPGMLQNSTLLQKLNAGDYAGAAKEFGRFIYATDQSTGEKKKSKGLANRRLKERSMFMGVA